MSSYQNVLSNDSLSHLALPASPEALCGKPVSDEVHDSHHPNTGQTGDKLICDTCSTLSGGDSFIKENTAAAEEAAPIIYAAPEADSVLPGVRVAEFASPWTKHFETLGAIDFDQRTAFLPSDFGPSAPQVNEGDEGFCRNCGEQVLKGEGDRVEHLSPKGYNADDKCDEADFDLMDRIAPGGDWSRAKEASKDTPWSRDTVCYSCSSEAERAQLVGYQEMAIRATDDNKADGYMRSREGLLNKLKERHAGTEEAPGCSDFYPTSIYSKKTAGVECGSCGQLNSRGVACISCGLPAGSDAGRLPDSEGPQQRYRVEQTDDGPKEAALAPPGADACADCNRDTCPPSCKNYKKQKEAQVGPYDEDDESPRGVDNDAPCKMCGREWTDKAECSVCHGPFCADEHYCGRNDGPGDNNTACDECWPTRGGGSPTGVCPNCESNCGSKDECDMNRGFTLHDVSPYIMVNCPVCQANLPNNELDAHILSIHPEVGQQGVSSSLPSSRETVATNWTRDGVPIENGFEVIITAAEAERIPFLDLSRVAVSEKRECPDCKQSNWIQVISSCNDCGQMKCNSCMETVDAFFGSCKKCNEAESDLVYASYEEVSMPESAMFMSYYLRDDAEDEGPDPLFLPYSDEG